MKQFRPVFELAGLGSSPVVFVVGFLTMFSNGLVGRFAVLVSCFQRTRRAHEVRNTVGIDFQRTSNPHYASDNVVVVLQTGKQLVL